MKHPKTRETQHASRFIAIELRTMAIAGFMVDSLSEGDGRCGVSKRNDSRRKKRNALPVQSFWSMRFGLCGFIRQIDEKGGMCSLEEVFRLRIVRLSLRTENEGMPTCGSGSQGSELKDWHLFQQATTNDLCPGPMHMHNATLLQRIRILGLHLLSNARPKPRAKFQIQIHASVRPPIGKYYRQFHLDM